MTSRPPPQDKPDPGQHRQPSPSREDPDRREPPTPDRDPGGESPHPAEPGTGQAG